MVERQVAGRLEISQSAVDPADAVGGLVGVRKVKLAEVPEARRADSHLPGSVQCSIDGDGQKDIGVTAGPIGM